MDTSSDAGSWIERFRKGESDAVQLVWDRYFARMVSAARGRLAGTACCVTDEEDVALSAFKSFWHGARDGRFSVSAERTDLWPLLLTLIRNKAIDRARLETRQKRGGVGTTQSGAFRRSAKFPLQDFPTTDPTPEAAAQIKDELCRLFKLIDDGSDGDLRRIVLWKLDGQSTAEIAARLGCVPRTVERKLRIIGSLWCREAPR